MSGQHEPVTWQFFPPIGDLLNSPRADFNPLQRQLIERFIAACKV